MYESILTQTDCFYVLNQLIHIPYLTQKAIHLWITHCYFTYEHVKARLSLWIEKTNLIKCQIVFFGSAWQPHFFFIHIEKSSQDILKKQVRFSKNDRICGLTSTMFTNLMRRSLSDGLHKHISALRPVPACPLSLGPESRCADCLSNPATRPGRSIIADSWRPGSRSVMMIK